MADMKHQRPPQGLRPRHVVVALRMSEIQEAIDRYQAADKAVPIHWMEELHELRETQAGMAATQDRVDPPPEVYALAPIAGPVQAPQELTSERKTPAQIRQSIPEEYRPLLTSEPVTFEEAWLNHFVEGLVAKLPPNQGFYERPSQIRLLLARMLGQARRDLMASVRQSMTQEKPDSLPRHRLMARDQGTGKEYLICVGYLDVLYEEARAANASGHDYWVTDRENHEVDAAGHVLAAAPGAGAEAQVLALAEQFIVELTNDVGEEGLNKIARQNAEEMNPHVCHSHDHCDSNMSMDAAFTHVTGVGCEVTFEPHVRLWGQAWDKAKLLIAERYLVPGDAPSQHERRTA